MMTSGVPGVADLVPRLARDAESCACATDPTRRRKSTPGSNVRMSFPTRGRHNSLPAPQRIGLAVTVHPRRAVAAYL
ncbi:MAG: hypothetical protein DMD33_10950 [Gemmatimonadetes bacterium]|nr:MAG: hypothetical protein DMD33_10950 [Gemmatimonadota bacterium]